MLQQLTGLPLAGGLPLRRDHGLPEEDGPLDGGLHGDGASGSSAVVSLRVPVLAPPHIRNLDEFLPLARVSGVRLACVRSAAKLQGADWIIVPCSKQVSGDLARLRAQGLGAAIVRHATAGGAGLGLCGGLQMLGRSLHHPAGHDGAAFSHLPGLGLLPVDTTFGATKRLRAAPVHLGCAHGPWAALAGVAAPDYEMLLRPCEGRRRHG